jgi:hypothetical protein
LAALRQPEIPAEILARRVISLQQASEILGVSPDTLKRAHSDKIIRLGARRIGMRISDVVALGTPTEAA